MLNTKPGPPENIYHRYNSAQLIVFYQRLPRYRRRLLVSLLIPKYVARPTAITPQTPPTTDPTSDAVLSPPLPFCCGSASVDGVAARCRAVLDVDRAVTEAALPED